MTVIACVADTQLGAAPELSRNRLGDTEGMLHDFADLCQERGVDVVLHLGDVAEKPHPDESVRLVWQRWAHRITMNHRLIVVAGNHGLEGHRSQDCWLETVGGGFEFVREPRLIDLGGCWLACLPWAPVAGLVARVGGGDRDEVNALAADCLVAIAKSLYAETLTEALVLNRSRSTDARSVARDTSALSADGASVSVLDRKPVLLATHFWLSGATSATGVGEGVIHEPVLDVAALEEIGFDAICSGHVHAGKRLSETTLMAGSPWVCNLGEVGQDHGCWILDVGA